jgi:hypothetical protein
LDSRTLETGFQENNDGVFLDGADGVWSSAVAMT